MVRSLTLRALSAASLLALTLAPACIPSPDEQPEEAVDDDAENLFVASRTIWPSTSIPVCWVNATEADAEAMEWSRDAIAGTWEAVSTVRFTGWGACAPGARTGIRILLSDENPYSYIGTDANRTGRAHSMLLNFSFASWSQVCQNQLEFCIRTIAVHEFGHALGFDHEQNRPDAPDWCSGDSVGSGDTVIGPWDLDSVMNYCNPEWSGNGTLSDIDIQGVQQIYGAPSEE